MDHMTRRRLLKTLDRPTTMTVAIKEESKSPPTVTYFIFSYIILLLFHIISD